MPQNVHDYLDAQMWMAIIGMPLGFLAVLVWGAIEWWKQRHEDDAEPDVITKLNLQEPTNEA